LMVAGLLLAGMTVLTLRSVRTRPYLAVGWFWYLITVLPVIGIIQVGAQARADRYTYIPMIGLSLMFAGAWRMCGCGGPGCAGPGGALRRGLRGLPGGHMAAGFLLENGVTLFRHAIEVTPPTRTRTGVWEKSGNRS